MAHPRCRADACNCYVVTSDFARLSTEDAEAQTALHFSDHSGTRD